MRFNDKELATIAQSQGQIEGRLQHRPPPGTFRDNVFRERYFRLVNNLLFYFRLNDGQIDFKEPVGVIVLENYSVRIENDGDMPFAFLIMFLDEPDKKHVFTGRSDGDVNKWVNIIRQASYQQWKNKLSVMQSNIEALKLAKLSIQLEKGKRDLGSSGDLRERPSPSLRRNPFLTPTEQSPKPPPRFNSPSMKKAKDKMNNNDNISTASTASDNSDDLIKL